MNKVRITVGRSHRVVQLPPTEDLIGVALIEITAALHKTYKAEAARVKKATSSLKAST